VTGISAVGVVLDADVSVSPEPDEVVLFAHGSGSSRLSPRNRMVAGRLCGVGLVTVLTDLLTADEQPADTITAHLRFNIGLPAERLSAVIDWIAGQRVVGQLRLDLFGASTGAAAALLAAADRGRSAPWCPAAAGRQGLAVDLAVDCAGATHWFSEPGTLDQVVGAAAEWFDRHLAGEDLAMDGYVPAEGDPRAGTSPG
jgi:putative phosphoribosyl transferase